MSTERSKNKQLLINIVANITIYVLQFGVGFVLTPYVVKHLGVEAYGFVQLSSQIISYTTLITVALNAMSSRFITIEYHRRNIEQANKFFSSVFYGNLFLSIFSLLACSGLVIFLESVIRIPEHLIGDVKLLFCMLSLNAILSIVCSIFNIATFVKNRLELRSIRTAIGSVITNSLLFILFSVFVPKLWFLGITGFLGTIYVICVNVQYTKRLTPELKVDIHQFDWSSIKMLLSAGLWSLVIVVSNMLSQGFDLLLSNVFVGAMAMGILSLSKSVPVIIQSITTTLATCFSPSWTQCYAKNDREGLKNELLKSITIMGFISSIPLALFFAYGRDFYMLWLPGQDYDLIYSLSLVGMMGYVVAMPLDALWEIFNVENKIKMSSIAQIVSNVLVFIIVIVGILILDDNTQKLFVIAGTRSIMVAIRALTFLSIKTASLVNVNIVSIYKPAFMSVVSVVVIVTMVICVKMLVPVNTWFELFGSLLVTGSVSIVLTAFVVLSKAQRAFLTNKTLAKFRIK